MFASVVLSFYCRIDDIVGDVEVVKAWCTARTLSKSDEEGRL